MGQVYTHISTLTVESAKDLRKRAKQIEKANKAAKRAQRDRKERRETAIAALVRVACDTTKGYASVQAAEALLKLEQG